MKPRQQQSIYIVAKNYTSRRIILDIIENKVYENFKIELTPGSKVAGIVYDPNGKPVKGATVATFQFTNHPVVTDANGTFEIDGLDPAWQQHYIHATHPNYPAVSTSFSPANAGETAWKDFVLKPGVTVYGQVTSVAGQPVGGVTVGNTTSRSMWNCVQATTDTDGKYELKNVDVGELVLWAVINEYAPYVERFSLDDSQSKRLINIRLDDPLPLYGRIVDRKGNPVSGVNVSIREYKGVSGLSTWQDRLTSDYDGTFIIPNAPPTGKVILSVFAEQVPNTHPELEAGRQEEHLIQVDRAGRVYGKVVDDKTGESVERFNVKLNFSKKGYKPGMGYAATWGESGHNFDSPKGFFDTGRENIPIGAEYAVTVHADGFDTLTIDPVVVQPISSDPNRTVFRLKAPTAIAGRVVDINDVPIAGARIRFLTDDNKFEHWDDRDTAFTDSKGQFVLSGVGSQEQCIYVTAETFAPYIGSSLDLPKGPEDTTKITLEPGAEVFGRVIDANGQGIADARVTVNIFLEQLRNLLRSPWPNLKQATTDADGYYEVFDLPTGVVSVSVNSSRASGNRNFAQKSVHLKAGSAVELNFGDEAGFALSGTVRIGQKPVEKASVYIHFQDQSTKRACTDSKGRFRIIGIPSGTHELNTNYYPDFVRPGPGSLDQQLFDRRPVNVEDNIEIDVDLGDGSVSGKIPDQFGEPNKLRIVARRWSPAQSQNDLVWPAPWWYFEQPQWQYARTAKIDPQGNFRCSNLREGRYYLLLLAEAQSAAISDVFELAESEHLENVALNVGTGTLQIHVLDSQTQFPVPNAAFGIKNWDLSAIFYSMKLAPEKGPMVTDDHGNAEFSDLPNGRYAVWVRSTGYLTAASDLLNISDDKITPVTIYLEPAAVLRFELSQELKRRITADTIYLRCRVTNLDTQQLVPNLTFYRQNDEHMVWLDSVDSPKVHQAVINLPQGSYDIEYRLYRTNKGEYSYKFLPPALEGTISVELQTGQTELITISEQP